MVPNAKKGEGTLDEKIDALVLTASSEIRGEYRADFGSGLVDVSTVQPTRTVFISGFPKGHGPTQQVHVGFFRPIFVVDPASVYPHLELASEVASSQATDWLIHPLLGDYEYDLFVRMPPASRHTFKAKVKSARRAKPRAIDSEDIP